jgi:hypothetical protein
MDLINQAGQTVRYEDSMTGDFYIFVNAKNNAHRIICIEKDWWGDVCLLCSDGALYGPNEVTALWWYDADGNRQQN